MRHPDRTLAPESAIYAAGFGLARSRLRAFVAPHNRELGDRRQRACHLLEREQRAVLGVPQLDDVGERGGHRALDCTCRVVEVPRLAHKVRERDLERRVARARPHRVAVHREQPRVRILRDGDEEHARAARAGRERARGALRVGERVARAERFVVVRLVEGRLVELRAARQRRRGA